MTNPVDLVFERLPLGLPADLVFGDDITSIPDESATLAGTLPPLSFVADVGPFEEATVTGTMPGLTMVVSARYDSDTSRPTVGRGRTRFQAASAVATGRQHRHQGTDALPAGVESPNQAGAPVQAVTVAGHRTATPSGARLVSVFTEAARVAQWTRRSSFQSADALHDSRASGFRRGAPAVLTRRSAFEVADPTARARSRVPYREATELHARLLASYANARSGAVAARGVYERAVPPNGGPYVPPIVPPNPELCYTPSPHLLFSTPWSTNTGLLFFCENHDDPGNPDPPPATVIVPIRSVYIVVNDIILRRVSNNLALPTLSLSLSIDADSWTWAFSASLPASALDDVLPDSNGIVELEASINGNSYRLLAENVARERSFGKASIRVSGRGRNAILSAPYAPVLSFANDAQRTAQQLMADVLTVNGVPLGWDIDWGITDWLVPAGAFAMQGTYIEGVNAIAGAAGAYIQPHPTAQTLRVLLRYPVAPWAWNTATPDYEIPSAVMTRESVEWQERPDYNRVFVSGTAQGVLGQVTRDGTAGDLVAPLVTDPLITAVEAARQRGIAVLGDTGRQAAVRLSLPVLAATGVIPPGKLVRYVDGTTTRLGLVRAVSVDASGAGADLRQTITLETHP
ncbi:MAG: hypothetical protein RIS35_3740 [Pseudomonadota bacterium]